MPCWFPKNWVFVLYIRNLYSWTSLLREKKRQRGVKWRRGYDLGNVLVCLQWFGFQTPNGLCPHFDMKRKTANDNAALECLSLWRAQTLPHNTSGLLEDKENSTRKDFSVGIVFGVNMSSYKLMVKITALEKSRKEARSLCMAALSTWFVFVGATSAV